MIFGQKTTKPLRKYQINNRHIVEQQMAQDYLLFLLIRICVQKVSRFYNPLVTSGSANTSVKLHQSDNLNSFLHIVYTQNVCTI
jgi:hypothetical protein